MIRFRISITTTILAVAIAAAGFFYTNSLGAADGAIPVYFDDSVLLIQLRSINNVTYLPLREIVTRMGLQPTEVAALETLTIRSQNGQQLVLTRDARSISVNDRVFQLSNPIRRDNGEWLAPLDILGQGLGRITGTEFRYRPEARRIFAGKSRPSELAMAMQELGPITRLTLRSDAPIRMEMRRESPRRVVFAIEGATVEPIRERLDPRGRLVTTVAFDDGDGRPKLAVEITDAVTDIRTTPAEDGRIHFVDFVRRIEISEVTTQTPPPALAPVPSPPSAAPPTTPSVVVDTRPDPPLPTRRLINVIVLDPGHGGTDLGGHTGEAQEKDLTLAIAKRMRVALESRLGSTVLLTRDSDIALTNEARSALANNNQANLLVSIHIGQSTNMLDLGAVYVMKDSSSGAVDPAGKDRLFLPWHFGYRAALPASNGAARLMVEELSTAVPPWKFPVRYAPVTVLASASMPSIALEVGNLSNPESAMGLADPVFHAKLANAAAAAIERYAMMRQVGAF